jgi:O-acetylhomoserine (thiol)-lyase
MKLETICLHGGAAPEQQADDGITPDLVRLSVGIEHIDDILADLDQALAEAAK